MFSFVCNVCSTSLEACYRWFGVSLRGQFSTFEQCQEWLKRLNAVVHPPSRLEDLFSFAFHAWCMEVYAGEKEQHGELCRPGAPDSLTGPQENTETGLAESFVDDLQVST